MKIPLSGPVTAEPVVPPAQSRSAKLEYFRQKRDTVLHPDTGKNSRRLTFRLSARMDPLRE